MFDSLKKIGTADFRSLALLRVGVATLTLLDLLIRLQDYTAHYTNDGVYPLFTSLGIGDHILASYSSPFVMPTVFLVEVVAVLFLMVGYKTKIATLIAWLMLLVVQDRNPYVLQGGDVLHRMILFWGIFLPWNRRFALDAIGLQPEERKQTSVFSLGVLAFFIQIGLVYLFNAIHKSSDDWRITGEAIYYALSIDQFSTPLTPIMAHFHWVTRILTYFVAYLEFVAIFFLLSPIKNYILRFTAALLLIGMHIGIGLSMRIGLFPLFDIISLTAFFPSFFWNWLFRVLSKVKRFQLTIYYDDDCGFCQKIVNIIRTFFVLPSVTILPAVHDQTINVKMHTENSWVIKDNVHEYLRFDGVIRILSASPLFFFLAPFFSIHFIKSIGNKFYRKIAQHRKVACRIPRIVKNKRFTPIPQAIVVIALLFLVVCANLVGVSRYAFAIPIQMHTVISKLRLYQNWNMFSPTPLREDGWYVAVGKTTDGKEVNVLNEQHPVSFDRPNSLAAQYPNNHWRKYMMNMYLDEYAFLRQGYVNWLCRNWNGRHPENKMIHTINLYFMSEWTNPYPIKPTIRKRILMENYLCSSATI